MIVLSWQLFLCRDNWEFENNVLASKFFISGREGVQLVFEGCVVFAVKENFNQSWTVYADFSSLSDNFGWVNHVFKQLFVDRSESTRSGTHLTYTGLSRWFMKNSALSNNLYLVCGWVEADKVAVKNGGRVYIPEHGRRWISSRALWRDEPGPCGRAWAEVRGQREWLLFCHGQFQSALGQRTCFAWENCSPRKSCLNSGTFCSRSQMDWATCSYYKNACISTASGAQPAGLMILDSADMEGKKKTRNGEKQPITSLHTSAGQMQWHSLRAKLVCSLDWTSYFPTVACALFKKSWPWT